MGSFRVAIVGVCASGKTTLADGLSTLGYEARSVPQEHSFVCRLFARGDPDFLVMLDARLDTVRRRREVPWGQERLDDQLNKLALAREACDLYLPTDDLPIEGVRAAVVAAIEAARADRLRPRSDKEGEICPAR